MKEYVNNASMESGLEEICEHLIFQRHIITQDELADVLHGIMNIPKDEVITYLDQNERVTIFVRLNYRTQLIYEFHMVEHIYRDYFLGDEVCVFRKISSTSHPTTVIEWVVDINHPENRNKLLHMGYYSKGKSPMVGDVIHITELYTNYLITEMNDNSCTISIAGPSVASGVISNTVNGNRCRISEAVFCKEICPSKMQIKIEDQWFGYIVVDHLLEHAFPNNQKEG